MDSSLPIDHLIDQRGYETDDVPGIKRPRAQIKAYLSLTPRTRVLVPTYLLPSEGGRPAPDMFASTVAPKEDGWHGWVGRPPFFHWPLAGQLARPQSDHGVDSWPLAASGRACHIAELPHQRAHLRFCSERSCNLADSLAGSLAGLLDRFDRSVDRSVSSDQTLQVPPPPPRPRTPPQGGNVRNGGMLCRTPISKGEELEVVQSAC